jgi:hypothetical protein
MPKQLQRETIETAAEYLERIIPGITHTVSLFQEGNEVDAWEWMKNIVDGLQYIYDVVELTKDLQIEPVEMDGFKDYLQEMVDAIENGDSILLCDLLEYEIIPIMEEIYQKLKPLVDIQEM